MALLVTNPVEVTYLSGFTGEDSYLLVDREGACLITDGRFSEQSRVECGRIEVHVRTGAMVQAVAAVARKRKARSLAIQSEHVTVKLRQELADKLDGMKIVPLVDVVKGLRLVKDEAEVRAVRKAVAVAQKAMRQLLAGGARAFIGKTERDLAGRLEYLMCLAGAQSPAFDTIVAVGAHGSLPHYRPGPTTIRRGDAVLIDWGAKVGGYCSDLTRVVFVGRIPPRIAEIYPVVLKAQKAGISAIRPGVSCRVVDAAARAVIEKAGFGKNFVHSLGHGLGLEVHERPGLARVNADRLRSGMIVTVEPGIYLPGIGGVRIEDDVLVTSTGARRLSSLTSDPAAMTVR